VELRVVLEPDPDTEPEDAERLGRRLRDELLDHDVEPVPAGGGVLAPVIGTIRAWLAGGAGDRKVPATIDGDTPELLRATDAERAANVDAFVRRHQPA
jgi:hypothetical protein